MKYIKKNYPDRKTTGYLKVDKEDENYFYGLLFVYEKNKLKKIYTDGCLLKLDFFGIGKDFFEKKLKTAKEDLTKRGLKSP